MTEIEKLTLLLTGILEAEAEHRREMFNMGFGSEPNALTEACDRARAHLNLFALRPGSQSQ